MATANSPWEHPDPRGLPAVQGVLRVVVAIQCWGAAAELLRDGGPSNLSRLVFQGLSTGSTEGLQFDRVVGMTLLLCGLVTLVRPIWVALLAAGGWFVAQAVASSVMADGELNLFAPAEQVVRAAAPVSLALVDWWPPRLKFSLGRFLFGLGFLRTGAVISLMAQGLRTLLSLPDRARSLELVQKAVASVGAGPLSETQAAMGLGLLGGIDVGIAIAFVATRSKLVAFLMAAWCLFRISLWTFAFGAGGYADTLLRAGLVGAPVVAMAFSVLAVRELPPEILPAGQPKSAPTR